MTPDRLAEIRRWAEDYRSGTAMDDAALELVAEVERLTNGIERVAARFNPDPGGSRDTGSPTALELRALLDPAPPVADSEGGERDE